MNNQKFQFNVTNTNLAALQAKKAAISKGYMKDDFINIFVPQNVKKEILLNRGYWARHYCFNTLVQKFINSGENKVQILSIGCGLDTLPFNCLKKFVKQNFIFFETDLECVVKQKISFVLKNKEFLNFLKSTSQDFKIAEGNLKRLKLFNF